MNITCSTCGASLDDARRNTVCPHHALMSDGDLARKDAALALLGSAVRFAHEPEGPDRWIESVNFIGMVTVRDMCGEFAPHLFVPVSK